VRPVQDRFGRSRYQQGFQGGVAGIFNQKEKVILKKAKFLQKNFFFYEKLLFLQRLRKSNVLTVQLYITYIP
jgi:hypothetical protein